MTHLQWVIYQKCSMQETNIKVIYDRKKFTILPLIYLKKLQTYIYILNCLKIIVM